LTRFVLGLRQGSGDACAPGLRIHLDVLWTGPRHGDADKGLILVARKREPDLPQDALAGAVVCVELCNLLTIDADRILARARRAGRIDNNVRDVRAIGRDVEACRGGAAVAGEWLGTGSDRPRETGPWTASRLEASVAPEAQTRTGAATTDARPRGHVRTAMVVCLPRGSWCRVRMPVMPATPSEHRDAWWVGVTFSSRHPSRVVVVFASMLL
jgi:hypothetical protein